VVDEVPEFLDVEPNQVAKIHSTGQMLIKIAQNKYQLESGGRFHLEISCYTI